MRFPALAILVALAALPASGIAQTAPPTPAAAATASGKPQGISREAYIKRAADSAAARFDRMDSDHDGILTRAESAAYRAAHHRVRRTNSPAPAAPKQQ